ncbi:C4-dicarboxylate ABC transporter [Roseomonas eburnea]|uniref:C4-dicarboxylate ABC transporter n=1 Tax=Neoroseomonas eburnea TaxID=1346889 RepID=A0A9X9XBY9_9PROT|nr:C4-dicarboxylate ABC transporter [Neoroseomonas eburnea]MBR0681225.1 C4-dicarboxylate ABC transporter [Neoroseomonas eburnea]
MNSQPPTTTGLPRPGSAVAAHASHGLQHLPLPLFAAPMGIGGLGLAWREAAHVLGAPGVVGEALLLAAGLAWLLIVGLHLLRMLRHPEAIGGDLRHPVRSAFAGAATIGLMILAGGLLPYARDAAAAIWLVAAGAHVAIAVWTVRGLIRAPREAASLTPPLLIPLVGNILAPVIGAKLGFDVLSWMLFGLGALLWVLLQPLLLGRLITGPALPARLRPTLAILLAPPSVGALALAGLTHGFGTAPLIALGLAVFIALVLLSLLPDLASGPFAMSWWGWTFPSAAFAIALQQAAAAHPVAWQAPLLWAVLVAASAILAVVAGATLRAAAQGHLLRPEG